MRIKSFNPKDFYKPLVPPPEQTHRGQNNALFYHLKMPQKDTDTRAYRNTKTQYQRKGSTLNTYV